MKNIFIICIFLLSANLKAQECKYEKKEVDEFTGEQIVLTKEKTLASVLSNKQLNIALRKTGPERDAFITLNLRYALSYNTDPLKIGFKINQKLILILENDSIVTLSGNLEKSRMYTLKNAFSGSQCIDNTYNLSKRDIGLMFNNQIKKVRFYYFDNEKNQECYFDYYDDFCINRKTLIDLIKCIL